MSKTHPIIAVTGSSGAGTSTVKVAMQHIYRRNGYKAVVVEGDSFHKYERKQMGQALIQAERRGEVLSHFGASGNEFGALEKLFKEYGESGTGQNRKYLHNYEEAKPYNQDPGTFSPWEPIEEGTDFLFYEGLHGAVKDEENNIDVGKHVDLSIGVTPIVNLEWIQKIHRDTQERGYSAENVTDTILRRMDDYVHYMTPQYSSTHINFQRVPLVDTSNPFIARDIPTLDESLVVIRFGTQLYRQIDYSYLLSMLAGSSMSRKNTIVIPGGKMGFALETIIEPLVKNLVETGELEWRKDMV
ncbi:MAG: phosphoribulokinase [Enterobacterales bacterium]|nr:phosphoribulokinase [Enterobacterales bacterium]